MAATVLALLMVGVIVVHTLGARPPAWYPPCWVHASTGVHCPGCGSARAVHALGQGDVRCAFDQNALTVVMLPVLAVWAVVAFRRIWVSGRASAALPGGWALGVLIAVVVFTALRNLPWWPLTILAPDLG